MTLRREEHMRKITLLLIGVWWLVTTPASAKTWYNGGQELDPGILGASGWPMNADCSVSKQSRADDYNDMLGDKLIDHGEYVEVRHEGNSNSDLFFKTKAACKRFTHKVDRENHQEEERINKYR
jgi:hypothetical protein